jgi:hypothetical protein
MKVLLVMAMAAAALPALAENQLTDRERQLIAQQQARRQAMYDAARARCIEQRGVDCVSEEGLQEWLLLDRTREQAVLDTVRPITVPPAAPGAGTGSSAPPVR